MATSSKVFAALAFALVAAFAYVSVFGFASVYDDEGYNVAVTRLVSEGVPLYTGQFGIHGPLPYLVRALVLKALGVAVTHQSVRLWVWGMWLLSATALALAIRNLTGSRFFAIGSLIVVGTHLFPLRFNPGHPEDFIVLFLSLAVLVASTETPWLGDGLRVAMLGLIGAALLGTKINVGAFYVLGLSAWMLASLPRGKRWRAGSVLFLAAFTATPALLMRAAWAPEWQLLLVSTAVMFLTGYAAFARPLPPRLGWKHVAISGASAAAGAVAILAVTTLHGSRFLDILQGTVITAAKHSKVFLRPMSFGICTLPILAIFGWISLRQAIYIGRPADAGPTPSQSVLKMALVLSTFALMVVFDGRYYLALIGPVCWLVVFPGRAIGDRNRSARLFLALTACSQVLQIFPIVGTQTAWSSLLLCVCSLVLLHDAALELSQAPRGFPRFAAPVAVFAGGLALYALTFFTLGLWTTYSRTPSLGFGDSNLIRVPLALRADFDWIVASTSRYCDAIVTQPGLDSLLLWAKPGPELHVSPVLVSSWPLHLTSDEQREVIAQVSRSTKVCAVYNQAASEWWTRDGPLITPSSLAQEPLVAYIQGLRGIRTVGNYAIRGNTPVEALWKDDYLLNGVRDFDGTGAAVGVPGELLTSNAGAEFTFGFRANGPGLVLSIPQKAITSDEETVPMEPIIYVSQDGRVVIRSTDGSYLPAGGPDILANRLWHEMSLRREQAGWAVWLDAQPLGHTGDLLTEAKPPRYLQLGPAFVGDTFIGRHGWMQFFGALRNVRMGRKSNELDSARILPPRPPHE